MESTGDNVPDHINRDWYEREPGYINTKEHGQRGEMPGEKRNAVDNNNPGPF